MWRGNSQPRRSAGNIFACPYGGEFVIIYTGYAKAGAEFYATVGASPLYNIAHPLFNVASVVTSRRDIFDHFALIICGGVLCGADSA